MGNMAHMKTNIKTIFLGGALLLPLLSSCGGVSAEAAVSELKTAGDALFGSDAIRLESNGTVTMSVDVPLYNMNSDGTYVKTMYGFSLSNGKVDMKASGLASSNSTDLKSSFTVRGAVGVTIEDTSLAYTNQTVSSYVDGGHAYLDLSSASKIHDTIQSFVEFPEKAHFDASSYLTGLDIFPLQTYMLEAFEAVYQEIETAQKEGSEKLSVTVEDSSTIISYSPDISDLWPEELEDNYGLRDIIKVEEGSVMTFTLTGGAVTSVGVEVSTTYDEEELISSVAGGGIALSTFPGLELTMRGVFLTSMGSAVSVSFPDFSDYQDIEIPAEA